MRPSLFSDGFKVISKFALVVTGTYFELLMCINVVVSVVGGVKVTKNKPVVRCTSSDFLTCINVVVLCVCVCGGGAKSEFKTAALVLKCTSSHSLTCINVVIFYRGGKMNVNPRFLLQVPPPIC